MTDPTPPEDDSAPSGVNAHGDPYAAGPEPPAGPYAAGEERRGEPYAADATAEPGGPVPRAAAPHGSAGETGTVDAAGGAEDRDMAAAPDAAGDDDDVADAAPSAVDAGSAVSGAGDGTSGAVGVGPAPAESGTARPAADEETAGPAADETAGAAARNADGAGPAVGGASAGAAGAEGAAPGQPSLRAGIEAILMVVDEPVSEVTLAQVLERPREQVAATLRELAAEYTEQGRGFELREIAGGWRFYTRDVCAPLVERFVLDGQQARLTQAALETLAVVAYRQPVSRARVSAIRGVNSDGVIRTLTLRGLIEEAGHDPEHQAVLYRTTNYFLERLGLKSLDELPDLAPYLPDDVEGIEELQQ